MNELRFTASIRRALDESAARLPARVTQRLEAARAAALAQVPESVEAGSASRLAESSLAAARLPGARLRESRHPQAGLPETLTHPGSRPGSLSRSGGASRPGAGSGARTGRLLARLAVAAVPLAALVGGLFYIDEIEAQRHAVETAEVEAAVLTDLVPIAAYVDRGFGVYLKNSQQ
ncbi:MAG: DUF3619 family protein [Limnobacter sp.]|mgnify:CR=1 FL=1|nr:DUF3619 family protein [Limnobacter sp.]